MNIFIEWARLLINWKVNKLTVLQTFFYSPGSWPELFPFKGPGLNACWRMGWLSKCC